MFEQLEIYKLFTEIESAIFEQLQTQTKLFYICLESAEYVANFRSSSVVFEICADV